MASSADDQPLDGHADVKIEEQEEGMEDNSDEAGEGGEGEEEDDGIPDWEVKEITNVRCKGDLLEFHVTWETDGSKTWEPLENFPAGLEHWMVQDFKNKHSRKWENAMRLLANCEKQKKTKWTYETVDEDRFEKPDEGAEGEAKRLADPNRLEDPQEKFLKTYGIGIPGRMSRSKTRDILRNIEGTEPSTSAQQPTPLPEKKKRKRGGGRKKKEKDETKPAEPKPTVSVGPNSLPKKLDLGAMKPIEQDLDESWDHVVRKDKNSVDKNLNQEKKKTPKKRLNSSDSSESDTGEVQQKEKRLKKSLSTSSANSSHSNRIEGGANLRPISPSTKTDNLKQRESSQKKTLPSDGKSTHNEVRQHDTNQKRLKEEENGKKTSKHLKPLKVRSTLLYDSDEECAAEFASFGIRMTKHPTKEADHNHECFLNADLHSAILTLNVNGLESMMSSKGPSRCFDEICKNNSLHEILTVTYELCKRNLPDVINTRHKEVDHVFHIALSLLPEEIMCVLDVDQNTLLHCAINARCITVAERLIKLGSPLHIRNVMEMTPVESCIVTRNWKTLDMVLRWGGTFHHILNNREIQGADNVKLMQFINNRLHDHDQKILADMVKSYHDKLYYACKCVREELTAARLQEYDSGPVVCFPLENIRGFGFEKTIQFQIPTAWVNMPADKFMLAVIPMAYSQHEKDFKGAPRPVTNAMSVNLCGESCRLMTKSANYIFYEATEALKKHFLKKFDEKVPDNIKWKEVPANEKEKLWKDILCTPVKPYICTVSLKIEDKPTFPFMTCQLIRYKALRSDPRCYKNGKRVGSGGAFFPKSAPRFLTPETYHSGSGPSQHKPSTSNSHQPSSYLPGSKTSIVMNSPRPETPC